MEPCGFLWPRWQGSLAPLLLTEGEKNTSVKNSEYTEYLLTTTWYTCTNTSNTNLWVFGKVGYYDFEWFQDCHGSGSCVIQKVPHACLQKMWLCRRLGNCDSNLPKMSCFATQQRSTNICNDTVFKSTLRTRAQKLLIASGGKPLLLSAVKVKSRGSSQSLQLGGEKLLISNNFLTNTIYNEIV